jgi:ABC-type transport system involved in multi-copper enzyme maturation permease subunit
MKKFFRKIESYMLKLKIRFHKKSKRLGRVKRTDMGRLLSGEFFKFVKGGTFKVSVVVLILSMILTVSIYSADGSVLDLVKNFLGGETETDVFAMLDGINEDLLSIAGEFGVDIPTETLGLMDEYFGDDKKVEYLSTSPAEYYKNINPARLFEDELRSEEHFGFSEEMVEFILENRNFLKLILTTDTLMKAVQDFAAGNSSPLVNDIVKLIDDNSYIIEIAAAAINLLDILQDTPVVTNINDAFERLKNPAVKEEYKLEDFYAEFFGAVFFYEGSVAEDSDARGFISECYKTTRLYTVHNVSAFDFLLTAAPSPFDSLVFFRDIYRSGIIGALLKPDKDLTFINFLLEFAVFAAVPYELKEGEIPEGYDEMSGEEKADVLKNAKFEAAKSRIFEFTGENYSAFNTYIKTLPLFDAKTLGKIVSEDYLRTEILAKAPDIIDVYVRMFEVLMNDSTDNYKALTDFALYFAVLGDMHDMLYGAYYDNMVGLRNNVVRIKSLLDYLYNGGEYGKSSLDFIKNEVVAMGYMFDELLDLLADDSLSPEEQLLELDEKLTDFTFAYQNLAWFVWAGSGRITLGIYSGENPNWIPEHYDDFERQYGSFIRSMASVQGVVMNPSKSTAVKLENVRRLITNMRDNPNGFFSDVKKSGTVEESMTKFFDAFQEINTVVIDGEFFEENYAFIYEKIKEAFTAYFTVFKDKEFIEADGIEWLFSGEDAELMESLYARSDEFSYAEFRDMSRAFSRVATMIIDYVPKVYMIEVMDGKKITDETLSNMYGMMSVSVGGITMGITKYSTKSDIQKDLFYFENMELFGKLASPEALDNGYGFMNFGANFAYLFVIVIIIIIASGSIAGEYETGSVKLLLIRPYRRWKFLTAKILYVAICLGVMILFMYLFMLAVGALGLPSWEGWQGLSGRDVLVIFDAERAVVTNPFWVITLEYVFLYIHCLMYAIIGVVISTIAKSRVASVAAAGGVFFASNILSALLSSYSWYRFIIFNNTNLTAYISSGPSLGDMTMGFSAGIYLGYLALLLGLSYYIFEKRDAV